MDTYMSVNTDNDSSEFHVASSMDHGYGHNQMNSNFEFVSPFGGKSLHLEWIAARPSFDTANIWIEVALECKKRFPWAFGWMNSDLNLSDPRIAGFSQDPHTYKQAEINIHRFYLNFCRFVTLFSDSARRIFLKHFSENGFSHWSNSRCGPMLTSMLCNYSYCEMAISPQFQNQFDWPFSRLCGAIKFEQMALLVQQLNVSSDDIFLNLCSGIGHLAFFMSGATPAARLICLETNSRNHAAALKIKNHFDNWMGWFNKKHNPVELIHGDFLNGQAVFAELFKKATIVLINNESFSLDLDEKIKQNVVNELPIGARIISTRPLTPYVSRDATLHVSLLSTVEEPINRVYAQTRFFLNVKVLNKPIQRSVEQKQLSQSETQSPQPMLMSPEPISMSSEPVTSNIHLPTASSLPLSACSSNTSLADHSIEIPPSIILPVKIPEKDQNPFFPKGSPQRLKRLALEIGDAPEKRQKISSILDKVQQNSLANLLSKLQQHSLEDAKGDIVSFLEQLEPHLAMKETRISELLTALDERKVEIEKLHAEVEDRDRRIEAHQTVIKENINKLQKADREMKMSDNTIRQQSDRYQEIETKLGVLQKELRDREYVIQEMKVVFKIEKNELIEKRIIEESIISSQKYQNLEIEMQKLREKNKEQAAAIEQKDADFKRLYLRLKKRDELLRSQQKDDINKDLDLVRLSSTNRGIPDLEKEIKDLKAATSKQKTVIDEKQKEIDDLETRIKTKDDKIRSQMLEIAKISHKLQKQETSASDALEAEIKKKDEKLAEQQVKLMKLQKKEKKTERAVKRENNEDVAALRCEITKLRNMLIEKQNRMMLQESLLKSQETTIEMMKRMVKRGRESKVKNSDDSSNENSC